MSRPKVQAPARQYHISGKSVVRIDGRDIYLGKHDSPESIARYAVLISIYHANGMTLPGGFEAGSLDGPASALLGRDLAIAAITNHESKPILVRHVTAMYVEHVKEKYANSPQECYRYAKLCGDLDLTYGNILAADFGPVRLKEFRNYLVSTGLARSYVNRLTNCVIAVFAHAVSGELLDVNVVAGSKRLCRCVLGRRPHRRRMRLNQPTLNMCARPPCSFLRSSSRCSGFRSPLGCVPKKFALCVRVTSIGLERFGFTR